MAEKLGMADTLRRHGFTFKKGLGQNFLTDPSVPRRMAELAEIGPEDGVLEIGPGMGILTRELAARAGKVLALELDRRLLPVLEETLAGLDNVSVLCGDAMKADLAGILDGELRGLIPVVCANLPYNITTPVLERLFELRRFDRIAVMVQKEVAERIAAAPGTKAYGAFSVYCNWMAEPRILFSVPAGAFHPKPKVDSAVVLFRMRKTPPDAVADEALFFRIVRAGFNQRRKTLANALASALGPAVTKTVVAEALRSLGLRDDARGETLDMHAFAELTGAIHEKIG